MFCIHVPVSEINWPKKKSRKLRCLSAANVCRHGNAPATTRRGWPVISSGTVVTLAAVFSGFGGMAHQANRRGPRPQNSLLVPAAPWPAGGLSAVMTGSPSFKPSRTSVYELSVMPSLTRTASGTGTGSPPPGGVLVVRT